jgi:dTDP-4-dehydrorhamnose reductase
LIDAVPAHTLGYAARRPRYAVLASERGAVMPSLEDALARYLQDTGQDALRGRTGRERRGSAFGAAADRRSTAADASTVRRRRQS